MYIKSSQNLASFIPQHPGRRQLRQKQTWSIVRDRVLVDAGSTSAADGDVRNSANKLYGPSSTVLSNGEQQPLNPAALAKLVTSAVTKLQDNQRQS